MSPSALSRWETRINLPRGEHALKWACALGIGSPAQTGTAPTYQVGASAGNDEAAGYQPAASVEQIHEPTH